MKKEIISIVETINNTIDSNKPTFKIGYRNGFTYIDYVDNSKEAIFNNALSNKDLLSTLKGFLFGLTFNK
jgi:hypothetical protein